METNNLKPEEQFDYMSWQNRQRKGKITAGILLVAFGVIYLLREINVEIPEWLLSWQMFLIGLGFVILVKHKFRKLLGWVLVILGKLMLWNEWYPDLINTSLIWPILIIVFGLGLIFKRHKIKKCDNHWKKYKHFHEQSFQDYSEDEFINSTAIFGGVTKNIVSKNFKGAIISNVFGGTELDLMNVDFEQQAIIEISCVFGGVSLIIPSNWQVKSELNSIFGGIEDKRIVSPSDNDDSKILILKGDCVFGGIDIKSFK